MKNELRELLADLVADVRDAAQWELSQGWDRSSGAVLPEMTEPAPPATEAPAAGTARSRQATEAWQSLAAAARPQTDRRAPASLAVASTDTPLGEEGLIGVREELGDCQRCGLCEHRKNIVFGVGDPEADLMVIGEAPGEQEDERGEPFVGVAGQMLDKMLTHVLGLARDEVYIANVVKCRPPNNRNPGPEEMAACVPFLKRQIAAVNPKVVLVLGRIAFEQVLGGRGITRHRGEEFSLGDAVAIPTFHPAYLLRKPQDKKLTFADLKLVKQRYDERGGRRKG